MTRCMLIGMKVPRRFWPEAAQYAVHILNRSPTTILKDVTPAEKWSQHKPSIEHLRVFGSVVFAMIPYERRTKLEVKSLKCVMFGVSKEPKAYRLYDPITKRIIISKDVIFYETRGWNWEGEANVEEVSWDELLRENSGETQEQINNPETREDLEHEENGENDNAGNAEDGGDDDIGENTEVNTEENENHHHDTPREGRNRQKPAWMEDYVYEGLITFVPESDNEKQVAMFVGEGDPTTFEEAVKEEKWRVAMVVEIRSIEDNNTWTLVNWRQQRANWS